MDILQDNTTQSAAQPPNDMEKQINTDQSHHVTPRPTDMVVRLNLSHTITTKRRHSEPVSLFTRIKTWRKRRRFSKGTKRVKRTISVAGTTWTAKRPSWDLFRRERSPSEPPLHSGQHVKNWDDVIMNIYGLFCGDKNWQVTAGPSNDVDHDGENDDDDVDVDSKTQDEKPLIGRSSYALRRKATPRYSHRQPFSLNGNVHGRKRKRKLQSDPWWEVKYISWRICAVCHAPENIPNKILHAIIVETVENFR